MTLDPIWFQVGTWAIGGLLSVVGLLTWKGFNAVVTKLDEINRSLIEIASRVTRVEAFHETHEGRDDERFQTVNDNIKDLWRRLERSGPTA